MICEKCGAMLPKDDTKCPECGAENTIETTTIPAPSAQDTPRGFSNRRNVIIISLAAAIMLAGGVGTAVVLNSQSTTLSDIGIAQKYLSEHNYEQAIIEFQHVLEIDRMNVDAYLGIADAYIALGDINSAIEILRQGYELTGDDGIYRKLNEICDTNAISGKEYSYYSKNTISASDSLVAAIKEDGSICAYGEDLYGITSMCDVNNKQSRPVSVDIGEGAAVVVYDNGTVSGHGGSGAWIDGNDMINDYTDIVDAVCARNTSVLLKNDGTVICTAADEDLFNECESWKDIIDIEGYANSVVGLKKDGTVCYAGLYDNLSDEISGWNNIVKVQCFYNSVVAVKSDGTVLTAGEDADGQFEVVSAWTDIVDVSLTYNIVGLKSDGTVVTTDQDLQSEISGWNNVVAVDIASGSQGEIVVGLKSDGTLVAVGNNCDELCSSPDATNVRLPDGNGDFTLN